MRISAQFPNHLPLLFYYYSIFLKKAQKWVVEGNNMRQS